MINKELLKKAVIYMLPLPLIVAEVFYLANQSIQRNLDHILDKNVQVADEILSQIKTENRTALINPERCEALQQNLMFERDIDEMLIVKGDQIVCSSKQGTMSRPLTDYTHIYSNGQLSFGHLKGYEEQVLFLITKSEKRPEYKAITVVDRDYFGVTVGYRNDVRLKRSAMFVGGASAPKNASKHGQNAVSLAHSNEFNYDALIEASDIYVDQKLLSYAISAVPILLVFYLLIVVIHRFVDPQRSLVSELRKALKRQDLLLYYQPQYDATTGHAFGYEALIRWPHKLRGFISPDEFIPAAESNGLVESLTDYVLEKVSNDFSKVKFETPIHLGVNVPPGYLVGSQVIRKIENIHRKLKTNNVELSIEITERQLIDDSARKHIAALRVHGIPVLIDDFGTGQTALAVLQHMKVDYLKIDKCFIDTIGIESVNSTVLNAIVRLAGDLNVDLIAEGVETEEQAAHLRSLGVTLHQGYLYAKPLPYAEVVGNAK
ncbi:cyclic diguanylate phosphodiesterase [Vibrio harveyi]|uniref:EAL domain-containing protein n=1 Tax=Vibrio harveyi TaxID=669 RepID=UPI001EFD175D|nr:EAL domain-containing protein [Vibrio harveyi]MCG9546889.1 cyclic diguanylate phosphodiesterase [Vibrio harveyi]